MGLSYTYWAPHPNRPHTFDDVGVFYSNIEPIRGKRAQFNIRPIDQRRDTGVCIEKVSDDEYFLTDGWWSGLQEKPANIRHSVEHGYRTLSPITWSRDPATGDEVVTVRNAVDKTGCSARFKLLQRFLPMGLRFTARRGKQYIEVTSRNGMKQEFFLPKIKRLGLDATGYGKLTEDSGEMLQFRRVRDVGENRWERIGKLMPEPTDRVNKDLYVLYKPHMNKLYEWMGAIIPVLGGQSHEELTEHARNLLKLCRPEPELSKLHIGFWTVSTIFRKPEPALVEVVRNVLADEEHEARVSLAVVVAHMLNLYTTRTVFTDDVGGSGNWHYEHKLDLPTTQAEAKDVRRRFITGMRRMAGLNAVEYA